MFRPMRRSDRMLDEAQNVAVLEKADYGIFSTIGSNGYPCGTPFNFSYRDNAIYVHMANDSGTVAGVENNSKVCFTVVTQCDIVPEEFVSNYESVIAFGTASLLEGDEKFAALKILLEKYSKNFMVPGIEHIHEDFDNCKVVKIAVDHMTGKARRG